MWGRNPPAGLLPLETQIKKCARSRQRCQDGDIVLAAWMAIDPLKRKRRGLVDESVGVPASANHERLKVTRLDGSVRLAVLTLCDSVSAGHDPRSSGHWHAKMAAGWNN